MGADMLLTSLTAQRHSDDRSAFDFAAARTVLDQITDVDEFRWYDDGIVEDEPEFVEAFAAHADDDDAYDPTSDLAANRALAHRVLNDLEETLDSREVCVQYLGPWDIYTTGGMSYGDSPTDAFTVFEWVHQLPASVLAALGVVTSDQINTESDPDAIALDKLALGLGTVAEWTSDELDWIATVIESVRPNPGMGTGEAYLAQFEQARGFDPRGRSELAGYIADS